MSYTNARGRRRHRWALLLLLCAPNALAANKPTTAPATAPASQPSAQVRRLVAAQNRFAIDLFRRVSTEPGNVVASPYSVWTLMAMLHGAAEGAQAQAFDAMLGLSGEELHPAMAELAARLRHQSLPEHKAEDGADAGELEVRLANAYWHQPGARPDNQFASLLERCYAAEIIEFDIANHPPLARHQINSWIARQTNDRLTHFLVTGDLEAGERAVLCNVVYFRGAWADPFFEEETRYELFTRADGTKVRAPLMFEDELTIPYYADEEVQIAVPNYVSGDAHDIYRYAMVLILPGPGSTLDRLQRELSAEKLDLWLERASYENKVKAWMAEMEEVGLARILGESGIIG